MLRIFIGASLQLTVYNLSYGYCPGVKWSWYDTRLFSILGICVYNYIYIIQIDYWLYVISSELKYQLVLFSSPLSDISQNFCLGQLHVAAPKGSSAFQSLGWAFHGGQLDGSWKSHGSPMEKSMEKSHGLVKDGEREHPFFRDFVWEKWENTQLASWNQA